MDVTSPLEEKEAGLNSSQANSLNRPSLRDFLQKKRDYFQVQPSLPIDEPKVGEKRKADTSLAGLEAKRSKPSSATLPFFAKPSMEEKQGVLNSSQFSGLNRPSLLLNFLRKNRNLQAKLKSFPEENPNELSTSPG